MTLGEKLKKAREEKHISLAEMQEKTKIQARYIEALENDNYQNLPGEYNTQLFLRAYARQVGLDPEQVIREYQGAPIDDNLKAYEATATRGTRSQQQQKEKTWKRFIPAMILVVIFLVVVGSVSYAFISQHKRFEANNDMNAEYSVDNEVKEPKEAKEDRSTPKDAEKEKKEEKAKESAEAKKKAKEDKEKKKVSVESKAVSTNQINVAAKDIKGKATITLNGSGGRCWVSAVAGGQSLFQGVVEAGAQQTINVPEDTKNVQLQLGNAPMIGVQLNGKEINTSQPTLSKQLTLSFDLSYLKN